MMHTSHERGGILSAHAVPDRGRITAILPLLLLASLAIAGGMFALSIAGAGAISLENVIWRRTH